VGEKRTYFAQMNQLPGAPANDELESMFERAEQKSIQVVDDQIPLASLAEFRFYSEKIEANHWSNLFRHAFKRSVSALDFLDLSHILPLNRCKLVIKKHNKTVKFYIKDYAHLKSVAPLLFPFNFDDSEVKLKKEKETLLPRWLFLITKTNVLDFIMKENVKTIELSIFPFFGKVLGVGKIIDENGRKKTMFIKNPSKFLEIDMEKNPAFYLEVIHHPILKSMHVQSNKALFEKDGTSIGVDNFDVFKHTLIAGMSGTGKSKYISMKVKAIEKQYPDANIIVIDPHAEFRDSMEGKVVDFKSNYIEPLEAGGERNPLTIQLIVQLISSVVDSNNKYSERVLFYAVHLLSNINMLNLFNIGLLLTDSVKRMEFVSKTDNDEVKRFFSTEFENIYIHHFNDAILPIMNFIGQYELYMGGEKKKENLSDLLVNHGVTLVSFNPNYFGRNMIRFFAGAVIQQMYILAITGKLKKKTILVVDEFPVVETRVVKDILAEARKFNLYLYLSMQYLSQIREEVLSSILTNMYNLVVFKLSKEDAKYIGGVMDIKVEEYFRKNWSVSELEDEKKNLFIYLSPRECIVRLYGLDGKFMLPMKLKTVEVGRWM
jgi:hypothetical protein